ncbi:MAG: universal stress protein [Rhodospirillales bacterium]
MESANSILVLYQGTIGSETALDKAHELALSGGTELHVVEVVDDKPDIGTILFGKPTAGKNVKLSQLADERRKRLERAVNPICSKGIDVSCDAICGNVIQEVIRQVEANNHDLVVLAADRANGSMNGTGAWQHLLRTCPCPVWIVRPDSRAKTRRILAAVNPMRDGTEALGLGRRVLDFAGQVARTECAELTIFHAWDFRGKDLETSRSETTAKVMQRLIEKNRAEHEAALYRLLDSVNLDEVAYDVHMPKGDPCRMIRQFVDENDFDLVVVGYERKNGMSDFLYGNTAEEIIRCLDCPAVAVKRA